MPYLTLSGGNRIFYSELGEGPPALLIHGWACDGNDWSWLSADLARDHRVVVIDLRGHGRSTLLAPYTPQAFAADSAEVIEQLGLGSSLVVGHSLGAVIASALAVEHPDLVAQLVVIDPVYGADEHDVADHLPVLRKLPHEFAVAAFERFHGPKTPAWLRGWHIRRILGTDQDVLRDALLGLLEGDQAIGLKSRGAGYLQRRQAPTLAIYAGASAAIAEWDRSLAHGPADEIAVWAEHGHFLHQESPEVFADKLRRWLAGLSERKATQA